MGTTRLDIGKIPISKGEYQEGTAYQRLNQVTMLGSTYQSKIDDNTSAPAQMGADGAVENINTDKWLCVAVGNVSAARRIVYNNETSGLEAGNVQEAIDEVGSKVSDLSSTMLYGGERNVVESSVFSPNSSVALSTPISLNKVGDYVEIKAKVEGQGVLLVSSDFPSNKPIIRYQYFNDTTDKVQLYVWMNGNTGVLSSKFVSDKVLDVNKEHIIKVLLSSKSENICTFDIYIDNVKAEAVLPLKK